MFVITLLMIMLDGTYNLSTPKNISITYLQNLMYSSLFFYFVQGNLPIPISSSPPTKSSSSINWTIISETVVSCSMAPPHAVVGVVSFGRQVARVGWQLSSTGVGSLDVGMTWSHSLYIHSCVADRFWCQSCKKIYLVSSVWNNKTENKVFQNGRHRFKMLLGIQH